MANYLKTVACALAVVLLASLDDFCNRTRIRVVLFLLDDVTIVNGHFYELCCFL